jgi:hypothetical protein
MGRAVRVEGNPELAMARVAGATVTLTQMLSHAEYGGIAFLWVRLMIVEWTLAERYRDRLRDQHAAVLKISIDASNMRTIDDVDFLGNVRQRHGQPLTPCGAAPGRRDATRRFTFGGCNGRRSTAGSGASNRN